MTEHHQQISGRDITAPIVQSGRIDRLEINVGGVPIEVGQPPLTSWADRPALTPALTDLLMAQSEATQSLPYALLGVRTADLLNEIYVRQSLRPQGHAERGVDRDRKKPIEQPTPEPPELGERSVSVTEALNRGSHLVITGEPGAGKSTLGYMYVQRLAAFWLGAGPEQPPLTEPVLPLRIPARAFIKRQPWDQLLADGVTEALGGLVGTQLRPEVLGRRALGARWLVFVDGLDEIVETGIRQDVIRAIAHQMRRNRDHRLIITTRPLPDRELDSLCPDHADRFTIQPFGQVELEEFASAWFRAQDAITARERAADFLRQVRDNRLRDLVRNPLLATIAAITLTIAPNRPLPNNLADLFQGFMRHLLTDSASGRTTIADLRGSLADQPLRLHVFDWIARHRDAVITHLAVHRLENEGSLFEAAADYVSQTQDVTTAADLPVGWREDLHAVLDGSGVFGRSGDDLSFWHHSFAEFLAASSRAATIPPEFPDLDAWIDRGLEPSTRQFALFTIILWSRRAGNDLTQVFDRLLAAQSNGVLLAARLLADGAEVTDDLNTRVIDRLVDLIACRGVSARNRAAARAMNDVLASLDHRCVGPATLDRLRMLRDRPEIALATRIAAAAALGHLTEPEEAIAWLENFATQVHPRAVDDIVDMLPNLAPDGEDRAERLLIRLANTAATDYLVVAVSAAMLVQIKRKASAAGLVRDLVDRLRQDPGITPDMLLMPSRSTSERPLPIRDVWHQSGPTWGDLAELAAGAGCQDEALWAARRSLALPQRSEEDLTDAVGAMLTVSGSAVVDEVAAGAGSRPPTEVLAIVQALANADFAEAAAGLARLVLVDRRAEDEEMARAADAILVAPGGSIGEVETLAGQRPGFAIDQHPRLAITLAGAGPSADARRIARRLLDDPTIDQFDFWQAGRHLIESRDPEAADDVFRAAMSHSSEYWGQAAPLLVSAGRDDLARELMQQVFESSPEFDVLTDMAGWFLTEGDLELAAATVTFALPLVEQAAPDRIHALVSVLAELGRTDEAVALARNTFVMLATADQNLQQLAIEWLEAGGEPSAAAIVAEVTALDIKAEWRMEIAEEMAEAGLLKAAVDIWLDVVRRHGDATDQGVAASARLVACGHRDQAIDAITEQLADNDLLRPLLAWVVFSSPDATPDDLASLLGNRT